MVEQRFALLWGQGAYDIYNAKIQKKYVSDFDHGAGRRKNFPSADEENFLFLYLYLLAGKRK